MVRVFDAGGEERDMDWALEKYNFSIVAAWPSDDPHWEITELHEMIGPSSMTVRTQPPTKGVPVLFGWPDGEVEQDTNEDGQTGFGMGDGAYYKPSEGESGPHYILITEDASDIIKGLGMIAGTNHAHLEPTFSWVEGQEPSPGPVEGIYAIKLEGVLTVERK